MKKTAQLQVSEAMQKAASAFKALEQLSTLPEFEDVFHEQLINHSNNVYETTLFLGRLLGHVQVCEVLNSSDQ